MAWHFEDQEFTTFQWKCPKWGCERVQAFQAEAVTNKGMHVVPVTERRRKVEELRDGHLARRHKDETPLEDRLMALTPVKVMARVWTS